MAITGFSLLTSLLINGAICLVALLVFSVLRVRPTTRRFFMPKR